MKKAFITSALAMAICAVTFNANAQKKYTEGSVSYSAEVAGKTIESKTLFRGDSSLTSLQQGPADLKFISANKGDYFAVLVDVPIANKKFAAVATPAEIEEVRSQEPKLTFTKTTETKVINGFNCKKVLVKDTKSGSDSEAWVTNDIEVPTNSSSHLFEGAGGVPIQFTLTQRGQTVVTTVKEIKEVKVPAGTFGIPSDFEKVSLTDLKNMGGGN